MAAKKNTRKGARSSSPTTKATPRKRITPSKVAVSSVEQRAPVRSSSLWSVPKNRRYITLALILVLVLGALYLLRSFFVAAIVNGQPISRVSVVNELEKQSGKQVLDTVVTKTLILQEAKKQNVTVSQEEINQETKKIEDNVKKQGQTLDQVLALQGMDRAALVEQIRIQKTVEKILGKDIKVTDKEVDAYIETNKEALGADPTSNESKASVKQQLTQQKLSEKFQTWLDGLKKKAKINYFVSY